MSSKSILVLVGLFFGTQAINSQNLPSNLLQLKHNMFYFKGVKTKYNPYLNLSFSLVYNRFIKEKTYFFGFSLYHFYFSDHRNELTMKRGDVKAKGFMILTTNLGYRLSITPKRTFLARLGLAYRHGYEQQHYSVVNVGGRLEIFSTDYKYRNPGVEISAEQQFMLGNRWSLTIGAGYQYFLSRTTTNHHLFVNMGGGYAF